MTDEDLDALVKMLQQRNKSKHGYSGHPLYNRDGLQAADAITTLRAQLAEARAERDKMGRALNVAKYGQPDFSWEIHKMAMQEAVAQRDRAEAELTALTSDLASVRAAYVAESDAHEVTKAALAAQIDAAAGIAEAQEALAAKRANDDDADARSDWDDGLIFGTQVGARLISATIRAQPHDRAALDRMMRAERDKALREAANRVEDYCSDMPDLAGHGHSVGLKDAILTMVEQPEIGSGGKP